MRIKVSSDSTLDLSPELLKKNDIGVIPLRVIKDGVAYKDLIEITPEEIFSHVDNGGELCTTSGISVGDYIDAFNGYLKDYDAVIHITLSKEMSTCYQSACLAAQEFDNVYIVDSMNLSSAQGLVVLAAADYVADGLDVKEIVDKLNELTSRVEASFILDRLEYLRKGGRCSSIAAFGANLFNIKPSINVVNGKMVTGRKYRGLFDRCAKQYVLDKLHEFDNIDTKRIMCTCATVCSKSAIDACLDGIKESGIKFDSVIETYAGCTISAHCGPNCIGILFIRKV